MKKILYFFRKVWLLIKKAFLFNMAVLDEDYLYQIWVCVERPDGTTFNQCILDDIGSVPPKAEYARFLEKNYFGKGYKVCKIWLQKK